MGINILLQTAAKYHVSIIDFKHLIKKYNAVRILKLTKDETNTVNNNWLILIYITNLTFLSQFLVFYILLLKRRHKEQLLFLWLLTEGSDPILLVKAVSR